jgi:hypothetical protein
MQRSWQPPGGVPETKRYAFLPTWKTDGIRVFRNVVDLSRNAGPAKPIRIPRIETQLEQLSCNLSSYGGIVGIDPGQVYSAAAFFLPSDPDVPGSQVALRKRFLYGKSARNRRWLEERKIRLGITFVEDKISRASSHSISLAGYMNWVKVLQSDGRFQLLQEFYNSRAVRHRAWDSKMSMCSQLDQACEILERLPGEPQQQHPAPASAPAPAAGAVTAIAGTAFGNRPQKNERRRAEKPTLFVIGDGDFKTVCAGSLPSMHSKLITHFVKRVRSRKTGSFCVAVDEYMTSQRCPRCLENLKYLKRPPRSRKEAERKGKDDQGLVEDFRVQHCQRCDKFLHRDCAAAQCFTIIADCLLRTRQRPICFTR